MASQLRLHGAPPQRGLQSGSPQAGLHRFCGQVQNVGQPALQPLPPHTGLHSGCVPHCALHRAVGHVGSQGPRHTQGLNCGQTGTQAGFTHAESHAAVGQSGLQRPLHVHRLNCEQAGLHCGLQLDMHGHVTHPPQRQGSKAEQTGLHHGSQPGSLHRASGLQLRATTLLVMRSTARPSSLSCSIVILVSSGAGSFASPMVDATSITAAEPTGTAWEGDPALTKPGSSKIPQPVMKIAVAFMNSSHPTFRKWPRFRTATVQHSHPVSSIQGFWWGGCVSEL